MAKAKKATKKASPKNGKARKVERARIASEFAREKALTPNWKKKDVDNARATHHGVTCSHKGKTTSHSSLHQAWIDLGLTSVKQGKDGPIYGRAFSQHQVFRKALKIAKRLPYKLDGKVYNFAIVKG